MSAKDIVITIAIVIVIIWVLGAVLKVLGWLIHALLPIAAVLLIVYFVMRMRDNEQDKGNF